MRLFKKEEKTTKPKKEVAVKERPKAKAKGRKPGKYPDIIYQIHNEFNTDGDKLLKDAEDVLAQIDIDKGERLKHLGFGKTKQAKAAVEARDKEKLAGIINHYKFTYPDNKFITNEDAEKICKKYNLVMGEVSDYTGFVPEKNLKEIEGFQIRNHDVLNVDDWYNMNQELTMKIAAPVKDFDMTGKEVVGHEIKRKSPPDPVVFMPVKEGFLIVTAWGDEASDPIVVDQRKN